MEQLLKITNIPARRISISLLIIFQSALRNFLFRIYLMFKSPSLLFELKNSQAQLYQDLFALSIFGKDFAGYFVEFGATDGKSLSNTFLLEKDYGRRGLLAEPGKVWQEKLLENRKCHISKLCIWNESQAFLNFSEASEPELSTIKNFQQLDRHKNRISKQTYLVQTIQLDDLLDQVSAPREIDFLSIDTEGSEFKILDSLDHNRHQYKIIVCEHNYTSQRKLIFNLLTSKGYKRKLRIISAWDDWYVLDKTLN